MIGQWLVRSQQCPNHGSQICTAGCFAARCKLILHPPPTPSSHFDSTALPSLPRPPSHHCHLTHFPPFAPVSWQWHSGTGTSESACRLAHSPAIGGAPRPAEQPYHSEPVVVVLVGAVAPDPYPYPSLSKLFLAPLHAEISATLAPLASRQRAKKANLCFDSAGRKRRVFQVWKSLNPTASWPTLSLSCRQVRAR
jgi:hypothetical protein